MQPLRIRESIAYGKFHIGNPQLGDHRTIFELNHRMDHRLRMHLNLYLFRCKPEQPLRLDHLEPLVHHRRRIDRDLCPHAPVRVLQRLCFSHDCQFLHCLGTEGATGSRQQNLFHRVLPLSR